ncbi:MAG: FHA domain-containing protein [Gammaproteobacteria bacterium]|nr:FHA domain-containing protein [Gammaproteobacteria bacterium]
MAILLQLVDRVVTSKLDLDQDILTVGRDRVNDLVIEDIAVSGLHAQLEREEDSYYEDHFRYFLHDMGSTNGSFINGERILGRQELKNNDTVKIGWNEFKFIGDDYDKHEATAHILTGQ